MSEWTERGRVDRRHGPDRRKNEEYREAARARDRARYERIKSDPEYKARIRSNAAKIRSLYPEKIAARRMVRSAIEAGTLIRKPCLVCGACETHAHHEDYSKPLDVWWLCEKHHNERHTELRALNLNETHHAE